MHLFLYDKNLASSSRIKNGQRPTLNSADELTYPALDQHWYRVPRTVSGTETSSYTSRRPHFWIAGQRRFVSDIAAILSR